MDFPLQNKVVGSGKLPGYRIRKWGLVEESHHGIRNRSTERKMRDIMYGRSCTLCLFFYAKVCRRSCPWQAFCIYMDNESKSVPVHEKVLEKNEKTLEKGGRVVYNGGKW